MNRYQHSKLIDYLIALSLMLGILIFIAYPFYYVFKASFITADGLDFSYFVELMTQSQLIWQSLKLAVLTTLISTCLSVAVALYLYLAPSLIRKVSYLILALSMISPPFVTALSYINLFGRRGLITYRLLHLNFNPYGMWGIILMQSLGFLALNTLVLMGGLQSIDKSMINSARSLKATTSHILIDILIPSLKTSIGVVAFLTFVRSLSDFGTPMIIGGNFNTLASAGYMAVISQGNFQRAATINIILLIPALLAYLPYAKTLRQTSSASRNFLAIQVHIQRKGWCYHVIKLIAWVAIGALILQYSAIILSAFTKMRGGEMYFTLDNIWETRNHISSAIIRSILYSLFAAFFGALIGLTIGYYLVIRQSPWAKWLDFIATLPYIVPGTFFGLGYLLAFNHPPIVLVGTSLLMISNLLFKQLPFSSKIGGAVMQAIPQDRLHAAADLGATPWDIVKDMIIPAVKQGFSLAFINGFNATMTTVGTIIFLVYPGQKVLTLVMFDVIQSGKYAVGSVIAVMIMVICLLVNGLYLLLQASKRRNA